MDFGPYGNTWWSKKWLEAILDGASEQAIQQGVRYASRGQVSSIDIVDNRVISVVKGPNGGLHNNYIVFPKFPAEQASLFRSILRQHPAEMLALGNKAMSPSLELLMIKSGIQLFDKPEKVKMGCDCRDAQPCKYLVATFLKMAEQCDTEPAILFRIHGFDLASVKDNAQDTLELDAPAEANLVHTISGASRIVAGTDNALDFAEDSSESLFAGPAACRFRGRGIRPKLILSA